MNQVKAIGSGTDPLSWIEISNDQLVSVKVTGSLQVWLYVPNVPAFRGNGTLCGLFGNLDNNCEDDLRMPNGSVVEVPTSANCSQNHQPYTQNYGDVWIVPPYDVENPYCVRGTDVTNQNNCTYEDVVSADRNCVSIFLAKSGDGVFWRCSPMGEELIQHAYETCSRDVCVNANNLCDHLTRFVVQCQLSLPGTDFGLWRLDPSIAPFQCAPPICDAHSTFSSCASGCQSTCYDQSSHDNCTFPCVEGCQCEAGYVVDGTRRNPHCIPVEQCGCNDTNGVQHTANQPWLTDNCTVLNVCLNGTLNQQPTACDTNADCTIDNGAFLCRCRTGWTGDGITCADVDECANPSTCGAALGHGTCTNTLGSYSCTCTLYYQGPHCDIYKPKRHCADLFRYHGLTTSGPYTIYPPYATVHGDPYTGIEVFCEHVLEQGGWTVLASNKADSTSFKTFNEYETGFGNASANDYWMGLSLLHGMTTETNTSLLIYLYHCVGENAKFYWTYGTFSVADVDDRYRLRIVLPGSGTFPTDGTGLDPWAYWNGDQPQFQAYDNDISGNWSAECHSTGSWFDGRTNLNGNRFSCETGDSGMSLHWHVMFGGVVFHDASIFLRPLGFPNYT